MSCRRLRSGVYTARTTTWAVRLTEAQPWGHLRLLLRFPAYTPPNHTLRKPSVHMRPVNNYAAHTLAISEVLVSTAQHFLSKAMTIAREKEK